MQDRGAEAERRCRVAGQHLRERIWDPLFPDVLSARRIFLVPDGALQLVSFAALPVGERRYLVEEDLAVHYLTTIS